MPFVLLSIYASQETQITHISIIECDKKQIHSDKGKDLSPYLEWNPKNSNDLVWLLRIDRAKHMKTKTWHIQILHHLDGKGVRSTNFKTKDYWICHSPKKGWQANLIIEWPIPFTDKLFAAACERSGHVQRSLCSSRTHISWNEWKGRIILFVSELSSFCEHSSITPVPDQQRSPWNKRLDFCWEMN